MNISEIIKIKSTNFNYKNYFASSKSKQGYLSLIYSKLLFRTQTLDQRHIQFFMHIIQLETYLPKLNDSNRRMKEKLV